MRALKVRELQGVINSAEFETWHDEFRRIRDRLHSLRLARLSSTSDDFAVDLLFRAGELEELAAQQHTEFAEIENQSFVRLAEFESQRMRATAAWMHSQACEKHVEDLRQDISGATAELEAAKKNRSGDVAKLEERLRELARQRDEKVKVSDAAKATSTAEYERREAMWTDVEESWKRSLRANLARSEYTYQARRMRGIAEAYLSGETPQPTSVLDEDALAEAATDAESAMEAHLQKARDELGCVLIEDFMYFPNQGESTKQVFCVPLIDESEHLNVQVHAKQIYVVEKARGLDFIEPIAVEIALEDDPRLEAFFIPAKAG